MNYQVHSPFERSYQEYPADQVYAVNPTNNFEGLITKVEKSQYGSIQTIDDAIIVKSVDEKTRTRALHHFSTLQQRASAEGDKHTSSYYKGIAATVLGFGISVGSIVLMPIPSLFGAAAGVALSGLGIWKSSNDNAAIRNIEQEIGSLEQKKNEWQDPIVNAIAQRKQLGLQGFQYAFKNNLKGKVVHQQEVQELWRRDFNKLLEKKQGIQKMCEDNLLGDECMTFAWGQSEFADMEISDMCTQFKACRNSFLNFDSAISKEVAALEKQQQQIKNEIFTLRSQWLYPAECMHAQAKQEAEHLYEAAIQPLIQERNLTIEQVRRAYHYVVIDPFDQDEAAYKRQLDVLCTQEIQAIHHNYNSHPAVIRIERAYENDRRKCDFLLTQSQLVVHGFFDQRLNALKRAYNNAKNQIADQKSTGHQHYKTIMDSILGNIGKTDIHEQIKPASVMRNWTLPNSLSLEPNWNDVYGNTPRFHSDFSSNISELSWNLFWGNQGLGRFSSCPSSSWRQFSSDRMAFPFRQQWFNLHTTPVHCNAGMFTRPVCVPTFTRTTCPSVPTGTRSTVHTPPQPVRPSPSPRREEIHVTPGVRTPVQHGTGFATSTRREGVAPTGTGFATTTRRGEPAKTGFATSTPREDAHTATGTRKKNGFATTANR